MASSNHRDILVVGTTDDKDVTVSATRDREGKSVVLHLCNPSGVVKPVAFDFAGKAGFGLVKATSLSAPSLEARNTPDDPDRISPVDVTVAFRSVPTLKPYSYTVVEFRK